MDGLSPNSQKMHKFDEHPAIYHREFFGEQPWPRPERAWNDETFDDKKLFKPAKIEKYSQNSTFQNVAISDTS